MMSTRDVSSRPTLRARRAALALLLTCWSAACEPQQEAVEGDPLQEILGEYVSASGFSLHINGSGMAGPGGTVRFSEGLRGSGRRAKFREAVIREGTFFDDECEGYIEPVAEGVRIESGGDEGCAAFSGTWTFDTTARTEQAERHMRRLEFGEARELLEAPLNPRDKNGKAEVGRVLESQEMEVGLEWLSLSTGSTEHALAKTKELIGLRGHSAPAARTWLVSKAIEACNSSASHASCFVVMDAAIAAEPTEADRERFGIHALSVASTWFDEAAKLERGGKTEEAMPLFEAVCRLAKVSEPCTKASSHWGRIKLRAGQREYQRGHYGKARPDLEAALLSSDETVTKEARRLLESPQLLAGCALEAAEARVAADGPSDALAEEFAAVCTKGPQTQSCVRARSMAADVLIQLARKEITTSGYAGAEARLNAMIAQGGNAAYKARAMLREPSFVAGRRDEGERGRADAVIAQCKAGRSDCEAIAAALLKELGASSHAARVKQAVVDYQRALADTVIASCAALKDDCVSQAEQTIATLAASPEVERIREAIMAFHAGGAIARCEAGETDCEARAAAALQLVGETHHAERIRQSVVGSIKARAERAVSHCKALKPDCVSFADEALKTLGETEHANGIRDAVLAYRAAMARERCDGYESDCEAVAKDALGYVSETSHASAVTQSLANYRKVVAELPQKLEAVEAVAARCRLLGEAAVHADACFPTSISRGYDGKSVSLSSIESLGVGLAATFFGSAMSPLTEGISLTLVGLWIGLGCGLLLAGRHRGQAQEGLVRALVVWGLLIALLVFRGGFGEAESVLARSGIVQPETTSGK